MRIFQVNLFSARDGMPVRISDVGQREALHNAHDLRALQAVGPDGPITLVALIHRKPSFEGAAKDFEVSHDSMTRKWKARSLGLDGLQVFDLGNTDQEPRK